MNNERQYNNSCAIFAYAPDFRGKPEVRYYEAMPRYLKTYINRIIENKSPFNNRVTEVYVTKIASKHKPSVYTSERLNKKLDLAVFKKFTRDTTSKTFKESTIPVRCEKILELENFM